MLLSTRQAVRKIEAIIANKSILIVTLLLDMLNLFFIYVNYRRQKNNTHVIYTENSLSIFWYSLLCWPSSVGQHAEGLQLFFQGIQQCYMLAYIASSQSFCIGNKMNSFCSFMHGSNEWKKKTLLTSMFPYTWSFA